MKKANKPNEMVSVIVPTYRRDESLKKALFSLAKQTYKNIEIILVDDNDDERWNAIVEDVVHAFRQSKPDVSMIFAVNKPNQGSAKTRNKGISLASGQYITFLDDDDIYLPRKIERQVLFMLEGDYDFSVTDLELFNEKGKLVDRRIRDYICDTSPDSLFRYHMLHHLTGTDTMMFKKEYLLKIGGFEPIDVGDEFYLMHKAIEGGGKFGYLPGCDIQAIVHTGEGGLSSGEQKIKGEKVLFAFKEKHFDKLDKKSIRYIKMRHHAVVAYAYLRMRYFIRFGIEAGKAFVLSPIQCVRLYLNRK